VLCCAEEEEKKIEEENTEEAEWDSSDSEDEGEDTFDRNASRMIIQEVTLFCFQQVSNCQTCTTVYPCISGPLKRRGFFSVTSLVGDGL
jgi:hypothetical protein